MYQSIEWELIHHGSYSSTFVTIIFSIPTVVMWKVCIQIQCTDFSRIFIHLFHFSRSVPNLACLYSYCWPMRNAIVKNMNQIVQLSKLFHFIIHWSTDNRTKTTCCRLWNAEISTVFFSGVYSAMECASKLKQSQLNFSAPYFLSLHYSAQSFVNSHLRRHSVTESTVSVIRFIIFHSYIIITWTVGTRIVLSHVCARIHAKYEHKNDSLFNPKMAIGGIVCAQRSGYRDVKSIYA